MQVDLQCTKSNNALAWVLLIGKTFWECLVWKQIAQSWKELFNALEKAWKCLKSKIEGCPKCLCNKCKGITKHGWLGLVRNCITRAPIYPVQSPSSAYGHVFTQQSLEK